MAAPPPHTLIFSNTKFPSHTPLYTASSSVTFSSQPNLSSRFSYSNICRCQSSTSNSPSDNSSSSQWKWKAGLLDVFKIAIRRLESYINSNTEDSSADDNAAQTQIRGDEDIEEHWDWDRWKKHFDEIDYQEQILAVLKSQLNQAVYKEDYEDAGRLKVAIAAASTNDIVGSAISCLNRGVLEERYFDAAFLRDNACTGLVGWWAGFSDDVDDPHGLIIRITAEHGRYMARTYSPRQLATAAKGAPLFEVFLTTNKKGEFNQQAVYLKRREVIKDYLPVSSKSSGPSTRSNSSFPTDDASDFFVVNTEDTEVDDNTEDDAIPADGLPGFQSILRDMMPGVKVKVLKLTAPGKVDRDLISKVIEQIIEDEEDEEEDTDIESTEEDEDIRESDLEKGEADIDTSSSGILGDEDQNKISVKVVISGLPDKFSGTVPAKSFRVPAKLKKNGRSSFCFSIDKDVDQQDSEPKRLVSAKAKLQGQRSIEHVMFDLAEYVGKDKIPLKVLKDVSQLINLSLNQSSNRQPLSGSTTFHRINIPASSDPLNGDPLFGSVHCSITMSQHRFGFYISLLLYLLRPFCPSMWHLTLTQSSNKSTKRLNHFLFLPGLYIGAHGLYTSEVIHVRRKFGQWKEIEKTNEPSSLEFYEYVEAIKITGDPYVPAGQVAFRAKVGKGYQLPHKGIIPEEFGVIARYKGQGRLADPGFKNPRWVDGELVILDGKYIKEGPVIGFVYWAPEYHFLVFFNRLKLEQ